MEELKTYIETKIIKAAPMPCPETLYGHKEGDPGYLVKYPDGYQSWSPKDVFEEAYRPTSNMSFGLALEAMKKGKKVARKGWNVKDIFIEIQTPDSHSKMTAPHIYIDTTKLQTTNPDAPRCVVPWFASQTDMLSDDWFIVEEQWSKS